MNCKRCGEELGEYCPDCLGVMLTEAVSKVRRGRKVRRGIIVYEGDPLYAEIIARREEQKPDEGEAETRKALADGEGITFPNAEEAIKWLSEPDEGEA